MNGKENTATQWVSNVLSTFFLSRSLSRRVHREYRVVVLQFLNTHHSSFCVGVCVHIYSAHKKARTLQINVNSVWVQKLVFLVDFW